LESYAWLLIPIVAILAGTVKTWIRVNATQRRLGSSTDELERDVAALTRARNELIERVQNLEAIVVSQTWGVLQDHGLSPAEKERKLEAVARREIAPKDLTETNQNRAEQLASQLRVSR
jgi:hypothetical protein